MVSNANFSLAGKSIVSHASSSTSLSGSKGQYQTQSQVSQRVPPTRPKQESTKKFSNPYIYQRTSTVSSLLSVKPPTSTSSAFSQASQDIQTRKHEMQMSRDYRQSQTITNNLSSNLARKSESRQALNSFNTSVERLNLRGPIQPAREEVREIV